MSDGLWEVDRSAVPAARPPRPPRPPVDRNWVTMRVLVTVKAYPSITDRHGEAVCCAGVRVDTDRPEWVRLFPVPHRSMATDRQFHKYDVVDLQARRSADDDRPESWEPNLDSLEVSKHLGSDRGWADRARHVEPLVGAPLCQARAAGAGGPSLVAFRPLRPLVLTVTPREPRGTGKDGIARQMDLVEPSRQALEDMPYTFRYRYRCGEACTVAGGHHQTILDWEIGEAYRSWRGKYPDPEVLMDKMRQRWEREIPAPDKDLVLFAGNQNSRRNVWCILGTWWPPAQRQGDLLDLLGDAAT